MAAADAIVIFRANSATLKYEPMFYFTQNWFRYMYVSIVYVIPKYILLCHSIFRISGKQQHGSAKSYEAVTAMAVALVAPHANER